MRILSILFLIITSLVVITPRVTAESFDPVINPKKDKTFEPISTASDSNARHDSQLNLGRDNSDFFNSANTIEDADRVDLRANNTDFQNSSNAAHDNGMIDARKDNREFSIDSNAKHDAALDAARGSDHMGYANESNAKHDNNLGGVTSEKSNIVNTTIP